MLHTIVLELPLVMPQNPNCDCCVGHLVEALSARSGIATAHREHTRIILEIDPQIVADAEAESLARAAGVSIAQRYDHPTFAVVGMDCADCASMIERALNRFVGVHYAVVNFTAAQLYLEYDREQTSLDAISALVGRLGYTLNLPQQTNTFSCTVAGMCCAAEAGPIEQAVRALPGVQQAHADPALARLIVSYAPQTLTPARIVEQVEQLGFQVDQPAAQPAHDQPTGLLARLRTRPRDLLTGVCGLLILIAWTCGLLGAPRGVAEILYILATLTGGVFVARNGWATLRATRILDINTLMTIAAVGALLIGQYAESAAVVFLFALGNLLESYTMERARRSIRALMQLAPATALVLRGAVEYLLPVGDVAVGDIVLVKPGDKIPLDGIVTAGRTSVNQAPITGESMPVEKAAGAEVFAGSLNGDGAIEARVMRPAQDSTLARIIHLVEAAQAHKAPAQRFIDVFARYYTPAVLVLAVLVATLPPLAGAGAWTAWLYRALVLLVIACPCALVISTPVSIVSAISAGARHGVLFKGGGALEIAGGLRALAFDKTGTLTLGQPVVTDVIVFADGPPQPATGARSDPGVPVQSDSVADDELLSLAAGVERRSTHPLARAIIAAAEARGLRIPSATDLQSLPGCGATADVAGRQVAIGNRAMFAGTPLAPAVEARLVALEQSGRTAMLVGYDGALRGIIAVADAERAESRAAVATLRRMGIAHIAMLTGDTAHAAERVAASVSIDKTYAGLLPQTKLAVIDELLAAHSSVGMVGDGVNDAPALARATVGIAMGAAGSDVALETADITLMTDDLARLPFAIGLSRAARRVIIQNIVFALVVKAIFMVAALLGVATLWMAVFADTGAALIVIANGMRLLRYNR